MNTPSQFNTAYISTLSDLKTGLSITENNNFLTIILALNWSFNQIIFITTHS